VAEIESIVKPDNAGNVIWREIGGVGMCLSVNSSITGKVVFRSGYKTFFARGFSKTRKE